MATVRAAAESQSADLWALTIASSVLRYRSNSHENDRHGSKMCEAIVRACFHCSLHVFNVFVSQAQQADFKQLSSQMSMCKVCIKDHSYQPQKILPLRTFSPMSVSKLCIKNHSYQPLKMGKVCIRVIHIGNTRYYC